MGDEKKRHQWTPEEAREAGRRGGSAPSKTPRNRFNPEAAKAAAKARWEKRAKSDEDA